MENIRQQIVTCLPNLRRYALALVHDGEHADDLVQDCLVRAMSRLHLWQPGSNMRTWLFSILHNQHINSTRRNNTRPDGTDLADIPDKACDGEASPESSLMIGDIDKAINLLEADQRNVILLVGVEQLSYVETAEVLNIPIGTVMSRLSRGRKALKEIMDRNGQPNIRRIK